MAGAWYSMRQVGNTATCPWRRWMRTRGRFLNQVVKRTRAYGGRKRTDEIPVIACTALRVSDRGLPSTALVSDAVRPPSRPTRSVWPSTVVVSRRRFGTSLLASRIAPARSSRRGKSRFHSLRPGMYGQLR